MISDLIIIIIGGLVTWRVAHIVAKEAGPKAIFMRLRAYLASKQKDAGGLFDMFSCVSCLSMYIGALTSLALAGDVLYFILYTFTFSAIAVIIERFTAKEL